MNKLLLIVLLCCTQTTFSQGYRGKRFSLSYQPGYSMLNPSYDFKNLILHHRLNLGFVIGKHFTINLNGSYTNSRETLSFDNYESVQVNDVSGGISFCYFYKNHQSFAPLGRYIGISFDYGTQNKARIVYGLPLYDGYPPEEYQYYDKQEKTSLMIMSIFTGKNFLIKEKILLGYGIQFGLVVKGNGPVLRHFIKPQFNIGFLF